MSNVIDPIVSFARNDIKMRVVAVTLSTGATPLVGSAMATGIGIVDLVLGAYITGSGTSAGTLGFQSISIQGNVIGVTVNAETTQAGALTANVLVLGY